MPEFIRTSALWIHLFKPCKVLPLYTTEPDQHLSHIEAKHWSSVWNSQGRQFSILRGQMTQLYFSGKTKWIKSREKSMKFSFKAYLGKNRSASSSLYNKWNTLHWKVVQLSHCLYCLSRQAGQAQDLTKMWTQVGWTLCSSLVGTALLKSPGYNLS